MPTSNLTFLVFAQKSLKSCTFQNSPISAYERALEIELLLFSYLFLSENVLFIFAELLFLSALNFRRRLAPKSSPLKVFVKAYNGKIIFLRNGIMVGIVEIQLELLDDANYS